MAHRPLRRRPCDYTGKLVLSTRDTNVDFWELKHCGNNECVVKNKELVKNVEVGDILS